MPVSPEPTLGLLVDGCISDLHGLGRRRGLALAARPAIHLGQQGRWADRRGGLVSPSSGLAAALPSGHRAGQHSTGSPVAVAARWSQLSPEEPKQAH